MKTEAFTRVELLATITAVTLLGIVAATVYADTRERSERLMCVNNQRLIGRGFNAWAAEHGSENPWWVSPRLGGTQPDPAGPLTLQVPGVGTFPAGITHNAWFQFIWVHEELPSPSVLLCPSDPGKQRASSFSTESGGLANLSMQNSAVSYLIGLHAMWEFPSELLTADRNVLPNAASSSGCSSRITGFRTVRPLRFGGPPSGWTDGLHGPSGNLLLNDGHVEQMTTADLNAYFDSGPSDAANGSHLLFP
jgi:hypothetical protein